jgi:phosphate transport system protein
VPPRAILDRLITDLRDDLLRLSSMTDKAIGDSIRALETRDANLARFTNHNDAALNVQRFAIEEKCYALLATQQPNTTNLREIVSMVSVATNLERIGDHAAGIARLTLRLCERPLVKPLVDIPEMARIGREMVKDAVDAFVEHNEQLAQAVVQRDHDVDMLQDHVYDELISIMMRTPSTVELATYLLWVSHNLERIGDRALNICERAVYVATGILKEFN